MEKTINAQENIKLHNINWYILFPRMLQKREEGLQNKIINCTYLLMYQHVSLQIVQPVELATAHFTIEFLVGIVVLLVHTQVGYVVEGLLTYVARVFALLIRHMRLFVFH